MIVQISYFIPFSLFDRQGVSQETTALSETKVNALGVALSELFFNKESAA